jgi:hypothetical protein
VQNIEALKAYCNRAQPGEIGNMGDFIKRVASMFPEAYKRKKQEKFMMKHSAPGVVFGTHTMNAMVKRGLLQLVPNTQPQVYRVV